MDGLTLDRLIGELRLRAIGRTIARVRARGRLLLLELAGERDRVAVCGWPRYAGLWLVAREAVRGGSAEAVPAGRDGHALLLLRKHLEGARVTGLDRVRGERTLWIETTQGTVALRVSGTAPAVTLVRDGVAVATMFGEPAWPLPEARASADWIEAAEPCAETAALRLRACPSLGPWLAKAWDGSAATWRVWQQVARESAQPWLLSRVPLAGRDAAQAADDPPELWPFDPGDGRVATRAGSWSEAAWQLCEERRRGERFREAHQAALKAAHERARRVAQLLVHLERDRDRLEPEAELRRAGEALLADPASVRVARARSDGGLGAEELCDGAPMGPAAGSSRRRNPTGVTEADVADPWGGPPLRVRLDPRTSAVENANRLFARARRNAAARARIAARIAQTRAELDQVQARERRLAAAREFDALPGPAAIAGPRPGSTAAPRRFLTSRGLILHVGRGARENHALTFGVAQPEDHWLHARDVPGAHVIVRDPEGRAEPADLREAAEVAAFYSAARDAAAVDVHVARRKHLRSVRGAAGRVLIGHSETLRVAPRDPEGRLRRR